MKYQVMNGVEVLIWLPRTPCRHQSCHVLPLLPYVVPLTTHTQCLLLPQPANFETWLPGNRPACKWHQIYTKYYLGDLSNLIYIYMRYSMIWLHGPQFFIPTDTCSLSTRVVSYHHMTKYHITRKPMKDVTWLLLCLCTNGNRSAALARQPFILPLVFVQAAVIRSW